MILNQAAIDLIQLEDPIGKKLNYGLDYKGSLSGNEATMAIAYGSMLYHTHKASRINPADSLRCE